jgi:hypothetical protein
VSLNLGAADLDPSSLIDLVKDNVIVQWCLIVAVILTIGTNTATKLKGPVGAAARWFQRLGERRVNREVEERRRARQQLLKQAAEGRAFADQEITSLNEQLDAALDERDALARLIREHMGWDHDRIRELITFGVRPGDIPTPPPLRVIRRAPRTDTSAIPQLSVSLAEVETAQLDLREHADTGENPAVVRADS